MAPPRIQVSVNDAKMKVFWDVDEDFTYSAFNIYWDTGSTMAAEAKFAGPVPNGASEPYSSKHVIYTFLRQSLPVGDNTGFYVRLKGVLASTGLEDAANAGPTVYIKAVNEILPEKNIAMIYGYDEDTGVWRKALVQKSSGSEAGQLDTV